MMAKSEKIFPILFHLQKKKKKRDSNQHLSIILLHNFRQEFLSFFEEWTLLKIFSSEIEPPIQEKKTTVFPRIVSAPRILFFFESGKCGNFHMLSALWQLFTS
jgi:hypothetical protein